MRVLFTTLLVSLIFLSGCTTVLKATTSKPIEPEPGERTFGTYIDDERIEVIAEVNLSKVDQRLNKANIHVNSFNGVVLLTGQINNKQLHQLAADTVRKIEKVRQVHNELQLDPPIDFLDNTYDTYLKTKIKSKLLVHKKIDSGRVKVVPENGVIYLMGLLTRAEADIATNIARNTGGVKKVVRAIEYID